MLTAAFLFCATTLAIVRRWLVTYSDDIDDEFLFRDWAPLESTILSYFLFRPIGMSIRPISSSIETNLEDGMELLIERLATPNLWLQDTFISNEYIKDLPVWHYADSEDGSSDSYSDDTLNSEYSSNETGDNQRGKVNDGTPVDSSQPSSGCAVLELKTSSPHRKIHKEERKDKGKERMDASEQKAKRDISPVTSAPNGMFYCTECAICLERFKRNQLICGLYCRHSYHQQCIMRWIYTDNHCCPKCRWPTYKQKAKLS
jgi:hypothetical protein